MPTSSTLPNATDTEPVWDVVELEVPVSVIPISVDLSEWLDSASENERTQQLPREPADAPSPYADTPTPDLDAPTPVYAGLPTKADAKSNEDNEPIWHVVELDNGPAEICPIKVNLQEGLLQAAADKVKRDPTFRKWMRHAYMEGMLYFARQMGEEDLVSAARDLVNRPQFFRDTIRRFATRTDDIPDVEPLWPDDGYMVE